MENQSQKKRTALIPLGLLFTILAITTFKDAGTPKFLMLGAGIAMLGFALYLILKSAKENIDKKK